MRYNFKQCLVLYLATLLFFLLLPAGCKERSTSDESKPTGFLAGTVTIGPLCPVEPCTITPEQLASVYAARKVLVYNADKTSLLRELSLDPTTGRYRTELEEGTYLVDTGSTGIERSFQTPATVNIISGQTTTLNISIDTGIR